MTNDNSKYVQLRNRGKDKVLAILDASLSPGASVVPQELDKSNLPDPQSWALRDDGTIECLLNGMVLDVLGGRTQSGTPVIVFPRSGGANQRWTVKDNGRIQSALGDWFLDLDTVDGRTRAVIASKSDDDSQHWDFTPAFALANVLAQPPVAFPAFTSSDEAAAYAALSLAASSKSTNDIRSLYDSRSIDFGARRKELDDAKRPDSIDKDAWKTVREQLDDEFLALDEVGKLFDNMRGFQTELSRQQSDRLDVLIGLSEPSASADLTFSILDVVSSLTISIVTELNPELEAVAAVADVIKGVVGVAVEAGGVAPSFTTTAARIKDAFSTQMGAAFAGIETAAASVATDWGKLQATAKLIVSTGSDSLRWPNKTSSQLVAAALPGFDRAVLRSVIPARFRVRRYLGITNPDGMRTNFGGFARWTEDLGGGSFNLYLLAAGDSPPNESLMKDHLWNAGQDKPSFFLRQNGWTTPLQTDGDTPSNDIIVRVVNQTLDDISVKLDAVGSGLRGSAKQSLAAIGGTGVWTRITSIFGERINVTVERNDGKNIGTFRINDEATVFLDQVQPASGYQFVLESSIAASRSDRVAAEVMISVRGGGS